MAATEDRTVLLERLEKARAALALKRAPGEDRETDDCPGTRHRHSVRGYYDDGCRCPSTVKAYDRKRDQERSYQCHKRANIDLRRADRRDAESIAEGYKIPRSTMHTRGLAVKIMRERQPFLTDRQVAWKLTCAGQGRWVSKDGGPKIYVPVSMRQVQRIQAALDYKQLRHPRRAGSPLDRSGRTR